MKWIGSTDTQESPLHYYGRIFRQRLWLILAVFCVIVTMTLFQTARTQPVYKASARLLFEREHPSIIPFNEAVGHSPVVDPMVNYSSYYQTQYKLLQSRSLAQQVIQHLQLQRHPEFTTHRAPPSVLDRLRQLPHTLLGSLLRGLRSYDEADTNAIDQPAPPFTRSTQTALVNQFLARLEVKPIPDTRLVDVSFMASDPDLAADVANALARLHIDHNLEMRFEASQEAVDWLNQRVRDMREKVEKAERAMQHYKEQHGAVSMDEHQNVVVQQLSELNSALTHANTSFIEVQTLYQEIQLLSQNPDTIDSISLVANHHLIQKLKENYATLQHRDAELEKRWGPRHPAMVESRAKMQALAADLRREVRKVAQSVSTNFHVAQARLNAIKAAFERKKQEAQQFNRVAIQYSVLKREADTNRQLYDALLTSLKQTGISSELKHNTIRIVDAAEVPRGSIRPRPMSNMLRAALIGLILGVGLALILESLDTKIHTPEEAEHILQLPALGVVGRFKTTKQRGSRSRDSLITLHQPRSQPAEAFKTLRANLLMSQTESAYQVLLVTSPLPQDGKTTVAANLAVVMAQMGRRVLLVDADLRHPTLHRVYGVSNDFGLSTMLMDEQYDRVLSPSVAVTPLHLIPAGVCPSSPSELLGSDRMRQFIELARQRYDTVILDTPPMLAVSDALVASTLVDGILVVIRSGVTPSAHARRVLKQLGDNYAERLRNGNQPNLETGQGKVLGVVVNSLRPRDGGVYYGKYGYYYQSQNNVDEAA